MFLAVSELVELHNEHSRRPNVFGESEMEHTIEILTGEITQVCVHVCVCVRVCAHVCCVCACACVRVHDSWVLIELNCIDSIHPHKLHT